MTTLTSIAAITTALCLWLDRAENRKYRLRLLRPLARRWASRQLERMKELGENNIRITPIEYFLFRGGDRKDFGISFFYVRAYWTGDRTVYKIVRGDGKIKVL